MNDALAWISDNWPMIAGVTVALLAVTRLIVALTPTPVDNMVLGVVEKLLHALASALGKDLGGPPSGEEPARPELPGSDASEAVFEARPEDLGSDEDDGSPRTLDL